MICRLIYRTTFFLKYKMLLETEFSSTGSVETGRAV